MCRILGYLGPPISLDRLVLKPEHSMLVQSYKPRELEGAVLNADGFGLGWHGLDREPHKGLAHQSAEAFVYRNMLPMWNDQSLKDLCRYIHAENFVVNIRSATDKMPVEISNCQPFKWGQILFVHNGLIENFFESLYRPIRKKLCDTAYRCIQGLTDSEHIFALLVHHIETQPGIDLAEALYQTMGAIAQMAQQANVRVVANIILSVRESVTECDRDSSKKGYRQRLIALRYDNQHTAPSFYLLKNSSHFPDSVILTSEPLFEADWQLYDQNKLVSIEKDLHITSYFDDLSHFPL